MADSDQSVPRRSRRSNIGVKRELTESYSTMTPAQTPRRGTKRVRFSDPGPVHHNDDWSSPNSSGLTPMIRRTSLLTPKRRRVSAPTRSLTGTTPTTTQAQDANVDGRVERRLRRSNVRDLVNKHDLEKRRSASQLTALHNELRARDREIYELRNATIIVDNERIWDLERQVAELQREVERRTRDDDTELNDDRSFNWTLAARDPFEDDFMDLEDDDELEHSHFGNATVGQFVCSTPSKTRSFPTSSFPTPPATSPTVPNTPAARLQLAPPTPSSHHAGIQVCLEDVEKKRLQEELGSLRLEMVKLAGTLEAYESMAGRLGQQLSSTAAGTSDDTAASPLDTLEGRVSDLLRSVSDRAAALQQLSWSISELGFPGSDAEDMLTSLATHFRAARLELEYLTPGEIALPLTSHGAEVLDLLLQRLRDLAMKVKEGEDSIDEYHEIELSLRKQLDARVTVMDGLRAEMAKAQKLIDDRDARIRELEVGNDRLKGAVNGYVRDISELEKLVGSMEKQVGDAVAREESTRQSLSSKVDTIEDLEVKLSAAARRAESLQRQLAEASASHTKQVASLNKQHGKALALRDARVIELRSEIDRVNESIRAAHETIRVLRVENGGLQNKMEDERRRAKAALDAMKEELQRVLQMSQDFLNTPEKGADQQKPSADQGDAPSSPLSSGTRAVAGGLLSGRLARRGSKKILRRPDSGVGLNDDEEIEG